VDVDAKKIAQRFLDALAANTLAAWDDLLTPDAGLIRAGVPSGEIYSPCVRVARHLMNEWSTWHDARAQLLSAMADGNRVALEFRIQATENNRYVEYNRSAFLTLEGERIKQIHLYVPSPIPSGRRDMDWIAPATDSADEINHLFEMMQNSFDPFEWFPPNASSSASLSDVRWGSGDAHPGSNGISATHWNEAEADAKIQAIIDYHRERNIGFTWFVNPNDTPLDLRARLERHGLVFAGDQAIMARTGLNAQEDIPFNPAMRVDMIDGTDDTLVEHALQITARGFNWTKDQVDERRAAWLERARNPEFRKYETQYVAWLDDQPVAQARVMFRAGIAYLGGASTLPEFRSRKVYSTLLRQRLLDAHARGYNIAAIHAEPMSRRVVSRYGFKEYAKAYLYAWMPVIDMNVVKSLVPDD
jgi:ketosteroid isomerase-like protein